MKLTLIKKIKEVGNIKTFIFKPDKPFKWTAGQYLIYSLPHQKEDLRGRQRFFTISSPPRFKYPTITTRIEKKPSSFKKYLNGLTTGETVNVKGPDGDFIINKNLKNIIFIAGGIGITPFKAILQDLDSKKTSIEITLLYASKKSNILFKNELDEIVRKNKNLNIKYYLSPKKIERKHMEKFITKDTIFYVSGPDSMVEEIEKFLLSKGVKEKNIKLDYFSGYKNY